MVFWSIADARIGEPHVGFYYMANAAAACWNLASGAVFMVAGYRPASGCSALLVGLSWLSRPAVCLCLSSADRQLLAQSG